MFYDWDKIVFDESNNKVTGKNIEIVTDTPRIQNENGENIDKSMNRTIASTKREHDSRYWFVDLPEHKMPCKMAGRNFFKGEDCGREKEENLQDLHFG